MAVRGTVSFYRVFKKALSARSHRKGDRKKCRQGHSIGKGPEAGGRAGGCWRGGEGLAPGMLRAEEDQARGWQGRARPRQAARTRVRPLDSTLSDPGSRRMTAQKSDIMEHVLEGSFWLFCEGQMGKSCSPSIMWGCGAEVTFLFCARP